MLRPPTIYVVFIICCYLNRNIIADVVFLFSFCFSLNVFFSTFYFYLFLLFLFFFYWSFFHFFHFLPSYE